MASLPPEEIAYQMAHIDDNWSYTLQVLCSVFTGLAVVMFGVRLFSRYTTKAYLGWDDWLGFLATVNSYFSVLGGVVSASARG